MREFFSYGPVDVEDHFYVPRTELIEQCSDQLVGKSEKRGHYFTIWAPRQTGKTWIMRQVRDRIEARFGKKFIVGTMSVQGVIMEEDDPVDSFLDKIPLLFKETFRIKIERPMDWEKFKELFDPNDGPFDRPVILFIDEFDSLPPKVIDRLVTMFRDMYLKRDSYLLHGLALIGVRAVLGVGSRRGSPFNVQRSLHIPNFSLEEVNDLFEQYREESDQDVEEPIVEELHRTTRGQPGLIGWFGELLTQKYNPDRERAIGAEAWETVYRKASSVEWNNTVLNLLKKAKGPYVSRVLELFSRSDVDFRLDIEWCNFLYLNGIIDTDTQFDRSGKKAEVCRFASPFVQERLHAALTDDLVNDQAPELALEPLDALDDVFAGMELDLPALLQRYLRYLSRLKAKGLNPWKGQPRRADMHLTEATGHFHLFYWLKNAIGRRCIIRPEFPTGNGKVDLQISCNGRQGIIEVKSFIDYSETQRAKEQAANYAKNLRLKSVAVALFVPVADGEVLAQLTTSENIDDVEVTVTAIGWVI